LVPFIGGGFAEEVRAAAGEVHEFAACFAAIFKKLNEEITKVILISEGTGVTNYTW